MLKLTLPDTDDLYRDLVDHPKVMRVLALSGGYTRAEACERLARNHGVIASFSRALTEGLTVAAERRGVRHDTRRGDRRNRRRLKDVGIRIEKALRATSGQDYRSQCHFNVGALVTPTRWCRAACSSRRAPPG